MQLIDVLRHRLLERVGQGRSQARAAFHREFRRRRQDLGGGHQRDDRPAGNLVRSLFQRASHRATP